MTEWSAALGLIVLAFILSTALTRLLITFAPRLGLIDLPSERKVHTTPTPRAGGIAIIIAFALSGSMASLFSHTFDVSMQRLLYLAATLLVFSIGLLDDLRPTKWQVRLIGQSIAAWSVLTATPFDAWWLNLAAGVWIVGLINALNMLDNMDALAPGVALIAATAFTLVPVLTGGPPDLEGVSLIGAIGGFLVYNRPPARIFLGDSGSNLLGWYLSTWGMSLCLEQTRPFAWLAPIAILAVPWYDLCSVVLIRLSQGRSPFHADTQHSSHRLVARGLSKPQTVAVLLIVSLANGIGGLALIRQTDQLSVDLTLLSLAMWWTAWALVEVTSSRAGMTGRTVTRS